MASMRRTVGIRTAVVFLASLSSSPLCAQRDIPTPLPFPRGQDPLVLQGPGAQIGASFRNLTASESLQNNSNSNSIFFDRGGVVIDHVSADSPASRAGLLRGDRITMFDGHRVRNAREFARLVEETPPGWTVAMTVIRERKLLRLSITPGYVTAPAI